MAVVGIKHDYYSRKHHTNAENNPSYKYDLKALEDKCLEAYSDWKMDNNENTRITIFKTLYAIGYAILDVTKRLPDYCVKEESAYEFALDFYEKIILGKFSYKANIEGSRFPVQKYFALSLRRFVYKYPNTKLISSTEFEEMCSTLGYSDELVSEDLQVQELHSKKVIANEVFDILNRVYTKEEIARQYPLMRELVSSNNINAALRNCPKVYDFYITYISILKHKYKVYPKLFTEYYSKQQLETSLKTALNSAFFLSTILNTNLVQKELLLALDIPNLYRLISVAGGKVINVPTESKMDSIIAAASAATMMVLEGKSEKESILEIKKEHNLIFSSRPSLSDILEKTLAAIDLSDEATSEPLFNTVFSMISVVQKMFDTYMEKMDDYSGHTAFNNYLGLSKNLNTLLQTVLLLNDRVTNKLDKLEN